MRVILTPLLVAVRQPLSVDCISTKRIREPSSEEERKQCEVAVETGSKSPPVYDLVGMDGTRIAAYFVFATPQDSKGGSLVLNVPDITY